ncbi:MAG TPA: glycosyltransferase family 1 protein [Acidimicrobiales bacterium]|nr:glycosyltransferase family 1 protein [Acidimicrobiales bacterium]
MTEGGGNRLVRVSVDATAVPARPAGAGRYVIELCAALARRDDVVPVVACRSGDDARWRSGSPGAEVVGRAPSWRPARLAWEQLRLPDLLARLPVDVHHGPHYTMPERAALPKVVTVHDLSLVEHPSWHQPAKVAFFRRAIRVAAEKADAIIAVSSATAERLHALFSPRRLVHVIPHGVDHARFRPLDPDDADGHVLDRAALRRMGAVPPYVAFVGTLEPRKDVPTLVRAFDRLAAAVPGLTLVLAGGRGWGTRAVEGAMKAAIHGRRVRLAGYVSEEQKAALLRGAAAVAYPSLEEGFGLPALEALACGAPLVTTKGSAMEEVTGDAAFLIPPGDPEALAQALETAILGGPEVERRRARGLETAARYTWDASAADHVEVYRSVLSVDRA